MPDKLLDIAIYILSIPPDNNMSVVDVFNKWSSVTKYKVNDEDELRIILLYIDAARKYDRDALQAAVNVDLKTKGDILS